MANTLIWRRENSQLALLIPEERQKFRYVPSTGRVRELSVPRKKVFPALLKDISGFYQGERITGPNNEIKLVTIQFIIPPLERKETVTNPMELSYFFPRSLRSHPVLCNFADDFTRLGRRVSVSFYSGESYGFPVFL